MEKINSHIIYGIFFSALGFIFLVLSLAFGSDYYSVYKHGEKTESIVKYIDAKERYTYVEFKVPGATVSKRLDVIDSSLSEGDKLDIYYDPEDTSHAHIKCEINLWMTYIIISVVFILWGVYFFIHYYVIKKQNKYIKEHGKLIKTDIIKIERKKFTNFLKKYPSHIISMYKKSGVEYHFTSEDVWNEVVEKMHKKHIKKINVYVDPEDMNKYYVDIEKLISSVK